jgi:hypothetical protein
MAWHPFYDKGLGFISTTGGQKAVIELFKA